MSAKKCTTVFSILEEVVDVHISTNETKKALKKLREIQSLKEKTNLSECEIEKLSQEVYWENILNPVSVSKKIDIRKSTQKEREKLKLAKKKYERQVRKAEFERIEAIEKEKRQKEIEERQKEREQERLRQEEKQRQEEKSKLTNLPQVGACVDIAGRFPEWSRATVSTLPENTPPLCSTLECIGMSRVVCKKLHVQGRL